MLSSYQPKKNLTKLQILDLSCNQLTKIINKELDGLRGLEEIRLNNNHLSKLVGKSIAEMKKLTRLNVSHNELKHLDKLDDFFHKTPNLSIPLSMFRCPYSAPQVRIVPR